MRRRLLAGLLVVLCAACRAVTHAIRLSDALNHEFAGTHMGVSLTDGLILTVTVADSGLTNASCQAQVGVAMRVGRFLRHQTDADLASLQVVNVAFTSGRKHDSLPVRAAHLPIRFSPTRIQAGLGAADSADAVGSCKAYEDLNSA